jgi:nitrate reductase gamma subunit
VICDDCPVTDSPDGQQGPERKPNSKLSWVITFFFSISTVYLVVLFPALVVKSVEEGSSLWAQLPYVGLALVYLVVIAGVDRRLGKNMTARILGRSSREGPKGDRDFVLFLRTFPVDELLFGHDRVGGVNLLTTVASVFSMRNPRHLKDTWERRLTHVFARFGSVQAVGDPGGAFLPPGASRFDLPKEGDVWKDKVSGLIQRARLVVIAASIGEDPGGGEGTLWEYSEALRLLPPSQIVLVSCAGRDAYERFRTRATDYHRRRAAELEAAGETVPPPPDLPTWPEPRRPQKSRKGFPFNGVVHFAEDWTAQFVHFDVTAERGPTPHARWRRTQRHQIKPWADACEQRLPGHTVRATAHPHPHFLLLGLLFLAWMGHWLADAWHDGTLWQMTGYALATFLGLSLLVRAARLFDDLPDGFMRVQGPDETKREPQAASDAAARQPGTRGHIQESVLRWPGRAGLGIVVVKQHLDEAGNAVPAPRPFSGVYTLWRGAGPRETHHVRGGIVLQERILVVDRIDRHSGTTSRQFAERARFYLISIPFSVVLFAVLLGLGAAGATPFSLFHQQTTVQIVITVAVFLLLMVQSGIRLRGDVRMLYERRLRPRVPTDLIQEPFALYLRPHPGDPLPLSPWTGPLDLDLKAVFSDDKRLFRVGHMPRTAPPAELARLPLPEDSWREQLTGALPYADLVVLPTAGTAPATLWQFTEAVRLLPPGRLLLLVPSGEGTDEEYARFRTAARQALAERRAALPADERAAVADVVLPRELPAVPSPGREPALRAAIHFDGDWTAAVLPFGELNASFAEIPRRTQLHRIKEELAAVLPQPTPV